MLKLPISGAWAWLHLHDTCLAHSLHSVPPPALPFCSHYLLPGRCPFVSVAVSLPSKKALFEGRVLLQSHKKWCDAYAVVTKSCVRCYQLGAGGGAGPPIRLVELAEDADALEAQLELLPDYARRSRHIELYSFCVKTAAAVAEPEPEHGPGDGCLLMAVRSASAMWEWALKIRWRDELPVPSRAPRLSCSVVTDYDDHFTLPSVLQNRLLHVMTYKRIGIHNVRIEVRGGRGRGRGTC